jgi:TonB family protein
MIPRFLVPHGSRPPAADAPSQRRRPTTLDERTLVPSMLPIVELDGKSTIPKSLPLESIAARVVVPRDVNQEAYNVKEDASTPIQPTDLDSRTVIPVGAAPPEVIEAPPMPPPADLVDLDVFMTGEVNLLTKDPAAAKDKWNVITRVSSFAFHTFLVLFILFGMPRLFPPHVPTQHEIDRANQLLTWIPPESSYSPRPRSEPARPQPPAVKVDPKVINRVAPTPPPAPKPAPEPPKREVLPDAPAPKASPQPDLTPQPSAPKPDAPKAPTKLDVPDMPKPQQNQNLVLPKRNSIQDSIQDAMRQPSSGGRSGAIVGPGPKSSGTPGGGGPGRSQGSFGNGYQLLTDPQGVDFSDYMHRMLETVRRNWYAVMPESAMLGEQGRVMLRFKINADGSVPNDDPLREMGSGKEPLDRAAISSIRSSNPFEPLPPAFHGPFIEIRIVFLYNLPIESAYQ